MKNLFFGGLIGISSFTLISCVTSLHNLATPENIVTDTRLAGYWKQGEQQILIQELGKSSYKEIKELFESLSTKDSIFLAKHYLITYHEKGLDYTWAATIVRIGKLSFVSLLADACTAGSKEIFQKGMGFEGTSSFAKLEWQSDNSYQLRFLNGSYIKEIVLDGKARIRHEYDPLFGTFVITAPPSELEQFLRKYGNDERLFKGGHTINLIRKL